MLSSIPRYPGMPISKDKNISVSITVYKVSMVHIAKAHRIPYENVSGMFTWGSLRTRKPENIIPMFMVKRADVTSFSLFSVELCMNLLASLV